MNLFRQISTLETRLIRKMNLACFVFVLVVSFSQVVFATQREGIADYVQIALEQNHEIRAAYSRWEAAKEKIRQAGSFPDPRLGAEYFIQPIETRTGPQEASISLSQAIPWPGRLSLDKKIKEHETEIARVGFLSTRLEVVRKIKESFIEYGYLGQAEQSTDHILELMQYLEGVARTNYSSGKATYTDVLKVQIEIDKLNNKKQTIVDGTIPVRAELNSLLGSERHAARPQPTGIPQVSLSSEAEDYFTLAHQSSPRLLAMEQMLNAARTDLDIADQGYYPDLSFSVKTIFTGEAEFGNPPDSGDDPIIAGLSFSIPLFYEKRSGAIAEKQASLRATQSMFQQTANDIATQVETILFRYREADRLQNLYENNLIPKVRQELDVALETYQSGQSSILELIDAEKNWLAFELARARAQADMAIQVARLEELTGTTLVDWDQNT